MAGRKPTSMPAVGVPVWKSVRPANQMDGEFLREKGCGGSSCKSRDAIRCTFVIACLDNRLIRQSQSSSIRRMLFDETYSNNRNFSYLVYKNMICKWTLTCLANAVVFSLSSVARSFTKCKYHITVVVNASSFICQSQEYYKRYKRFSVGFASEKIPRLKKPENWYGFEYSPNTNSWPRLWDNRIWYWFPVFLKIWDVYHSFIGLKKRIDIHWISLPSTCVKHFSHFLYLFTKNRLFPSNLYVWLPLCTFWNWSIPILFTWDFTPNDCSDIWKDD